MRTFAVILLVLGCLAAKRPDLTGQVVSTDGMAIKGATVCIYTAAVKMGTSPFCPGCYADCAKSAATDADGKFVIQSLDPELMFRVLVVAEGYRPAFVTTVDPAKGAMEAKLERLPNNLDPQRMLKGRVLGPQGQPVAGASVTPEHSSGIDPLSVTNSDGEFLLVSDTPKALVPQLMVEARGLAPHVFTDDARCGQEPSILRLAEGATVTGRVLIDGKPVAGIVMGLVQQDRSDGFMGEETIGTDSQGRFTFSNVGPDQTWYVYPHMTSLGDRGAVHFKALQVGPDGSTTDAGDIAVGPAYKIEGRIVLSDGKPVPANTRVLICREDTWDSEIVIADKDGRFTATGLPAERDITVCVRINGYRSSRANRSLNLLNMDFLEGKVDSNVSGLVVLLEPGKRELPKYDPKIGDKIGDETEKLADQPIEGAENHMSDAHAVLTP